MDLHLSQKVVLITCSGKGIGKEIARCFAQEQADIIRPMLEKEPERLVNQIPLGRLADPREIAEGVVFMASDKASYINGTVMEITGGKLCTQNTGRAL